GWSWAQAGAGSVESRIAVPGTRARARPRSAAEALPRVTPSLARHEPLFHLAQLWAVAVRLAREAGQLGEVVPRLSFLPGRLRRLGCPVEATQPHRRILQRGLVFLQRRFCLALRHQHVAEQLTH